MNKKQKLPKHIIAFESLDIEGVTLMNKHTGMCWWIPSAAPSEGIYTAVTALNMNGGWPKNRSVGKQIVF